MRNVSVICVVYNEEKRIQAFIRSFRWSNDVIIIDKSSTDGTAAVAKAMGESCVRIISVPYTDAGTVAEVGIRAAANDWVLTVTASDLIHPKLAVRILELINEASFAFKAVSIPFAIYAFGLKSRRSPWYSEEKILLFHKEELRLSDRVHYEYTPSSTDCFHLRAGPGEVLYHLTHPSVELMMERHIRYTRIEAEAYADPRTAVRRSARKMLSALKTVLIGKRTILLGWDGAALALAYLSYAVLEFLFVWQKHRCKAGQVYQRIADELLEARESRRES